jgi:hypothetical protein
LMIVSTVFARQGRHDVAVLVNVRVPAAGCAQLPDQYLCQIELVFVLGKESESSCDRVSILT